MEEELSLSTKPESKSKAKILPPAAPPTLQSGMSNEELVTALITMPEDKLIPWEMCELPSSGRFYKDNFGNKWPDGIVSVRAMTQTAEKVLATARLAETGQSIDFLFKECVKLPDSFDPADLLIGDRTFLLFYIRGITHGNIYEFAVDCPNDDCKKKSVQEYDLNLLADTIRKPDSTIGDEPFKIILPYATQMAGKEVWVQVRLLRGIDIQNMVNRRKAKQRTIVRPGQSKNPFQRRAEQIKETIQLDNSLAEVMEKNIINVMGVTDPRVLSTFISKMHARDSSTIREWLRDNTPGIDTTINLDCPVCSHNFTVELPISETFFRPSVKR